MVLREVKKIKEDEAARAHPPEKPERTLNDLLKNEKESALFGDMLETEGKGDLAERLVKGELDPHDMAELESRRKEFFEKMESVKEVTAALSEESIKEFAAQIPGFKDVILKSVSASEIKNIFISQMEQLAFTDPGRFRNIEGYLKAYADTQENAKKWDKGVEDLLRQYGIASKDYSAILAIDDDYERTEKIEALARQQIGGRFSRRRKGITEKRFEDIKNELATLNRDQYDDEIRKIQDAQDDVGRTLYFTLTKNKELWNAFNRVLTGETAQEGDKESLTGFGEAKGLLPEERTVTQEWEKFKTALPKKEKWEGLNAMQQDEKREQFRQQYIRKAEQQKGLWAKIMKGILEIFLNGPNLLK